VRVQLDCCGDSKSGPPKTYAQAARTSEQVDCGKARHFNLSFVSMGQSIVKGQTLVNLSIFAMSLPT